MVEGEHDAHDVGVVEADRWQRARCGGAVGGGTGGDARFGGPVENRGIGDFETLRPHIGRSAIGLNGFLERHGQAQTAPGRIKPFEKSVEIAFADLVPLVRPVIQPERLVCGIVQHRRQRMGYRLAEHGATMCNHGHTPPCSLPISFTATIVP